MRQHVNPLSKNFDEIEKVPSLIEMFADPKLPLHLDIGCAAGEFLFELALENCSWNYIGIEIRERLIKTAKIKALEREMRNLYFLFGNFNNIAKNYHCKFLLEKANSMSFNFPDPWFKKRHYKRRVIQPEFIDLLSHSMQKESLIFIKTDVKDLFDYMDFIISSNLTFHRLGKNDINFSKAYNPNKIKTNREKNVISDNLEIFERIYIKK